MVQWTLAYLASAWLLLQIAELLFDIFDLSDSSLRILTVILAFGLVVEIVLAWYHGEKGHQHASNTELFILAVVFGAAGAVLAFGDFGDVTVSVDNPYNSKKSRRITANDYLKTGPSWSPDAGSLVFVSNQSGNPDLWLKQRDGGLSQLTTELAEDTQPAWSPDGTSILFVSSRNHGRRLDRSVFFGYTLGGDIWSMPAFGGDARKLVDDAYNPAWASDGKRFAFDSSHDGPRRIWTADADGSNATALSQDKSDIAVHIRPAWSSNGDWLVYERQGGTQASSAALIISSADGSESFAITDGAHRDMAPAWTTSDSIVFASDRGGALNLWKIDVDFGRQKAIAEPVRITLGAGEDFDPAVAADGTLAYVSLRQLRNLWQVAVDVDTWAFGSEPERILSASWDDFAPALSHANDATAFSSDRSGNTDVWLLSEGASEPRQLTQLDGQDLQPVWSPDDSKLAFFSNARGNDDIWIKPLPDGAPVPITPSEYNDLNPYWSPGGNRVGFMSDRSGQSEVWTMNIDGSDARQLTNISALGHTARWSPDGQWLLFTSIAEGDRDIWAVSEDGESLRRLTTAPTQDAHGLWSPDGKNVLYLSDHQKMFVTNFDDEEPQHQLVFDLDETIDYVHLSHDGRTFQFTRQKLESDVWFIE